MSRFWRSKQLVSLCLEDRQTITQLATELEEESSVLFPSTPTPQQVFEYTQIEDTGTGTVITELDNLIGRDETTAVITSTTQTLTSTIADITISHPCSEIRNDSESSNKSIPSSNHEMQWLNEQTGCFESIIVQADISDNISEEEGIISESRKRKRNQKNRMLGKNYTGHKIVKLDQNTKLEEVSKEKRRMRDKPCDHEAVLKSDRSYSCSAISDEMRQDIFKYFWQLPTWDAKKSYINGLTQVRNILRRRKTTVGVHKKSYAFDCYLPGINGVKIRVCREMFLATFDLKKDTLQLWIRSNYDVNTDNGQSNNVRRIDKTPHSSDTATKTVKSDSVMKWLDLIPKIPSHYCRANSTRIYVEESFESVSHMHSVYTSWCQTNEMYAVKRKRFQEVLKEQKISIFKPRKDQCDLCVGHKQGNVTDAVYELHIIKKDEARAAKAAAIQQISEEVLVVSMDMQSVLLCPKLLVSEQYYKMKLALHNYTFHVKNNKDVYLYVWHEGDGGVTANNITSCIIDFIKKYCSGYKKVILISDGCTYQNKNKVLCSSLANLSTTIEIEQIILEKGHTMMEVDSVHSTLERKFKAPIYSPSDYVSRMREARPSQPYIVHHLDYTFFQNYEDVPGGFSSIRPGRKTGDPTVTDIRGLLYVDGEVKYKLRHSDDWNTLPQRRMKSSEVSPPTRLYNGPLKIDATKYSHLNSLKRYMHRDYHAFYENLEH